MILALTTSKRVIERFFTFDFCYAVIVIMDCYFPVKLNIREIIYISFLCLILISIIREYIRWHRLAKRIVKIPGPPYLPYIGNVMFLLAYGKINFLKMVQLAFKRYGPVYKTWMGPNPFISICQAEDVEVILTSPINIRKAYFYNFLRPYLGNSLFLSKGHEWHWKRKMLTPAFHFSMLEEFLIVFCKKANIFVHNLESYCGKSAFDISPHITLAAIDGICETALGINLNTQNGKKSEYREAHKKILEAVFERGRSMQLYFDFIFKRLRKGKEFYKHINVVEEFVKNIIRQKRNKYCQITTQSNSENDFGLKKKQSFLDLLFETKIDDNDIIYEVNTFLFGGHDTILSTLHFALFLLGNNLDCQEKVHEELLSIFQGGEREITQEDVSNMKYIERVIKETLRLYPPVFLVGREMDEDVVLRGYDIPRGSIVMIYVYEMHRNPKYFPDPERFDPDRFLPEMTKTRHPFSYIPFSAGCRNCIGQRYAILFLKVLLATFFMKYKATVVENINDIQVDCDLTLKFERNYHIRLEKRSSSK